MSANSLLMIAALATCASLAIGEDRSLAADKNAQVAPQEAEARDFGVGELIADLPLALIDGQSASLSSLAGEHGLVVLMATSACPISAKQKAERGRIIREFSGKGIGFLLVNPAQDEDATVVRAMFGDDHPVIPACLDPQLAVSNRLGARSTTDAFVIDRARTLVYRGAIDDRVGFGYERAAARSTWLRDAIAALIAGERPRVRATISTGCALPEDLIAAPIPSGAPTYYSRIARIVAEHCQDCHRPGESAPFALLDLAQIKAKRGPIKVALKNQLMPPWPEVHGGPFVSARIMPARDRADFLAWIENGMPEGDPADAPLPRRFAQGWKIEEPDLVLQLPQSIEVPAEGVIDYQYFEVPTGLKEDVWVQAIEIRPTAPENVHHVLVFLEYAPGHPRALEQRDDDGGLRGYFAGMVPGQGDVTFADGIAKFLPANAKLIFQVHYTANGKSTVDRTRMGLVYSTKPPQHELETRGVAETEFEIPPGVAAHRVQATHRFRQGGQITGLSPHMHLRGAAFTYELVLPDRTRKTILDLPRFDFNWQLFYELADPIDLPPGSNLIVTGVFDNSAANPANPDPLATVRFGEQTFDEMMIGYFNFIPAAPRKFKLKSNSSDDDYF